MANPVLITIKTLESLAADFAVDVQGAAGSRPLPPEVRVRKETLLTISVLLGKLREVEMFPGVPVVPGRGCVACEGD